VDWASVVLAGISGALGAAIAYLLVRNPRERRIAYVLALVISFATLNALARVFVLPHIRAWQYERKVEQELQEIPAYRVIQQSDPQTYEKIRVIVRDGIRDGQRPEVLASRIRAVISELVIRYIPYASDDAVIAFTGVMVREIEELTQVNPDHCYQFLFPEQYGPLDLMKHIDATTLQDDLAALAILIQSAVQNPQPKPDPSQSETLLKTVYVRVNEEYGDDIRLLDNPHGQSVDKEKVCTIIARLYRHVLNMPKTHSSLVLRYMFSRR
jgi:hypothetical protein